MGFSNLATWLGGGTDAHAQPGSLLGDMMRKRQEEFQRNPFLDFMMRNGLIGQQSQEQPQQQRQTPTRDPLEVDERGRHSALMPFGRK